MERRHATKPYYKASAARDYVWAAICNFLVGCMVGAAVVLGLTGCAAPLPADMVVTVTTYDDPVELYARCDGAEACVWTDAKTFCDMHLPATANGEYSMRHYWHEEMHCAGLSPDVPRHRR